MSDYIPEGVQLEILKFLPVVSLLRFRSVCKWWKQSIDSESFIQQHLAIQKPQFISESEDPHFHPSFDNLNWPIDRNPLVYMIIGTLHGVVCLYYYLNRILLWNPSIRKLLIVPDHYEFWEQTEYALRTRTREVNYSAFWIDPRTKQFKIVIFKLICDGDWTDHSPFQQKCGDMYSSVEQYWKLIHLGEARLHQPLKHNPCVVIGTVAYWPALDYDIKELGVYVVLLCFDFEKEVFDTIDAPSYDYDDLKYFEPVVCDLRGGCLSVVYLNPAHVSEVYSMQQGSWVNLCKFSVPCHITRIRAVVNVEEKKEKCRFVGLTDAGLVFCDTSRDECVPMKREIVNPRYIDVACYFVGSLIFP